LSLVDGRIWHLRTVNIGFGGKRIEALGKIEFSVTFGEGSTQRTEAITFDVVDINYPYIAIFGSNTLVKFVAVIHQPYLCMKLPAAEGVITVFGNQEEAWRCEDNASSANKNVHVIETPEEDTEAAAGEDPQASEGISLAEHTKKVPLCEDVPDRMVVISKGLEEAKEARLIQILVEQSRCIRTVFIRFTRGQSRGHGTHAQSEPKGKTSEAKPAANV